MKIINNITEKLSDDLHVEISPHSKVSIAAACFSVYAYEELKEQLEQVDSLRFIFTSPTFLSEPSAKEKREFYIPRQAREKTLHGSEFEIRLRNEFIAHTVQQRVKLPPPGGFLRIAVREEKLIYRNMIPGYKVIEYL